MVAKKKVGNKSVVKKTKRENINNQFGFNINNFLHPFENLNNSKYFTGIMLILVNLGSKYVSIELSKTQEAYFKYTIGRQILLFSILWVGTRDIVISLILTAVFVILANYLLNENSKYCIIPHKYKEINELLDTNGDGVISEKEIDNAIHILKQAKRQKQLQVNAEDDNEQQLLIRENFV